MLLIFTSKSELLSFLFQNKIFMQNRSMLKGYFNQMPRVILLTFFTNINQKQARKGDYCFSHTKANDQLYSFLNKIATLDPLKEHF